MNREEIYTLVKRIYLEAGKLLVSGVERHKVLDGIARYAAESEGLSEEEVVREVKTFLAEEEEEEE